MSKRADRGSGSISRYVVNGVQRGWQGWADLGTGADGKRKRVHLYAPTKREMRDKLNAVLAKHREGTLPRSGKLTVGQWLATWLRALESSGSRRPRTLEHYRLHVERYLIPKLGTVHLAELTATIVESHSASSAKAPQMSKLAGCLPAPWRMPGRSSVTRSTGRSATD